MNVGGGYGIFNLQMDKALGIDPGDARTGVAVSDDLGMLAHPLETLATAGGPPLARRLVAIARRTGATTMVVGVPRNMDGSRGPAAQKALALVEALRLEAPDLAVVPWDERLTTVAASRALHEAGRNTRRQKAVIDQVAAQFILQGWLDSRGA